MDGHWVMNYLLQNNFWMDLIDGSNSFQVEWKGRQEKKSLGISEHARLCGARTETSPADDTEDVGIPLWSNGLIADGRSEFDITDFDITESDITNLI